MLRFPSQIVVRLRIVRYHPARLIPDPSSYSRENQSAPTPPPPYSSKRRSRSPQSRSHHLQPAKNSPEARCPFRSTTPPRAETSGNEREIPPTPRNSA